MSACPVCPAAIQGPRMKDGSRTLICGIMAKEQRLADSILEGMTQGVIVSEVHDRSTYQGFCCGTAIPMVDIGEFDEPRAHYTFCQVYIDHWFAQQEGKERTYAIPAQPNYIGKDRVGMTDTLMGEAAAERIIEDFTKR